MIKLIIWDFDGTLVDSMPATLKSFNDGLEPFLGRRLTPTEFHPFLGPPEKTIFTNILTLHGKEKNLLDCYNLYVAATARRMKEIEVFNGIVETLQHLQLHHPLGIFTGRSRPTTDLILKHARLASHFKKIVTSDELQHHKPHPEGILNICKKLGVEPQNAVMIGDSVVDIKAGKSAGAHTIACIWDKTAPVELLRKENPTQLFSKPSEVVAWLSNMKA